MKAVVEPTLDEKKRSLAWARDRYRDEKLDYVIAAAVGHGFGLAAMRAEVDKLIEENRVLMEENRVLMEENKGLQLRLKRS